ncbi:MAG: NfeD family protein [Bdellovibrionales bacterium]|nr:NfeD family protein [Bdellovibrionales bacterium]
MEFYLYWLILGVILIVLEFIVPGAIVVFLGVAAMAVGGLLYFGIITTWFHAFIAWFIGSLFLMLFLRQLFVAYFEGDSSVENVDEDVDMQGSVVEVTEEVLPYKEGRVRFRETTWSARSDEELSVGSKARVLKRDGNTLIVQSL